MRSATALGPPSRKMSSLTSMTIAAVPHAVDSLQAKSGVLLARRYSTKCGMSKVQRPSEMMTMVGRRLHATRIALGIERQEVMANLMGVQLSTYNNWERGIRMASTDAVVRLLGKTGIGLDWIFAGEMRSLPYDVASKLNEASAEIGAVVGGPIASPALTRHSLSEPGVARIPPRKPRSWALHENEAAALTPVPPSVDSS